jgi:hypothetical protein
MDFWLARAFRPIRAMSNIDGFPVLSRRRWI